MNRKFLFIAVFIWLAVGVWLFFAMFPEHITPAMAWERIVVFWQQWRAGALR
ncbi:hypothetical protein LJC09_04165 [Desulfovibrio sp. OttesenSCG-928-F20]|nr:hypothetical protein [Desulfovibrio sp. OttesenSCG-928-F20]